MTIKSIRNISSVTRMLDRLSPRPTVKVVVIGDRRVGRTALVNRFILDTFTQVIWVAGQKLKVKDFFSGMFFLQDQSTQQGDEHWMSEGQVCSMGPLSGGPSKAG